MNNLICKDSPRCDHEGRCCHDCVDKADCDKLKCVNIPKTCGHCIDPDAKDTEGKPMLGLVSPYLIEAVGAVRTYGTMKYGNPDNWRLVNKQEYIHALIRHLCEYLKSPGSVDTESGLSHLAHMACNISFLIEMEAEKG